MSHIFLQMALWRSSDNLVYLPPTPVSKVLSTDDYVTRTNIYYYAGSSRLLTVGHPYFAIPKSSNSKMDIPKVSAFQYRVFRVRLPDPNKFGLPDARIYNPDAERLVWACTGVEVGRGLPLGVGLSGHPLYNKLDDTENSNIAHGDIGKDSRDNISVDNKQTQLCIVGCTPPIGEHWGKGTPCKQNASPGDCPPLELITAPIQDGDMVDTGYGAMDFGTLQSNKSDVPLDICQTTCKYPDYLGMAAEPYGDSMFFYLRKEQLFARHFLNRAGMAGDTVPDALYIKGDSQSGGRDKIGSAVYCPTPSGSMVTSETQLFNKPYWLRRAQGHNNGICWANQLFVTVVDTTRSTNMTLCVSTETSATYDATKFKEYLRHGEEYDLQFIFQLCKVTLTPEIMAYLHTMNSTLLEDWNFGLTLPPSTSLEDTYRFLTSSAITCQKDAPPTEKQDPYAKLNFWDVDLKDRFSLDLSQFPLGRKFLMQLGVGTRSSISVRKRSATTTSRTAAAKRKRTKK